MTRLKALEKVIVDNSPAIFTGLAVAGTITTIVLTARGTLRAVQHMERRSGGTLDDIYLDDNDYKEVVRETYRFYLPAATSATLTVGCIIASNRIGNRRAAVLAAAYSLSEKAFEQYRDGAVKKWGVGQEQALRDDLQQCIIDNDPVSNKTIILTGTNEVLCYESFTGRYFQCSAEKIKSAVNSTNFQLLSDGYVSLSEFYDFVGLPHTSMSDELGWQNDNMLEVKFSTSMSDDQRPCLCINYYAEPIRNYYKFR